MASPPLTPDAAALGRILLVQSALQAAPDTRRLAEVAVSGLTDIPGVKGCVFCWEGTILSSTIDNEIELAEFHPSETTDDSLTESQLIRLFEKAGKTIRTFPLETGTKRYGVLIAVLEDRARFEPYDPFIANTINLVALHIETQSTLEARQTENRALDDRVERCTSQLHSYEAQLKKIERLSKTGGWEWDIETEQMHWSDEVYRIQGIPPDSIVGESHELIERSLNCYHPEQRATIWEAFKRCAERGESYDLEFEITTENGHPKWIRTMAEPEYQDGRIVKVVGNIIDITDYKRSQLDLQNAIERQKAITKSGNVGFWEWDLQTNKVFYSTEWKSQIGYSEEEITDNFDEWQSRVHPDDIQPILSHVHNCIETATPSYQVEFRFRHKNGSYLWIMTQASVVLDESGHPVRVVGSHIDITQQKRTEEALRESEKLYHSLFDNMLNGFAYCRMVYEDGIPQDFIYLAVNKAFEAQTGLKNVDGRKVSEVVPGIRESDPQLFDIYSRVATTGKPEHFEIFLEALQMWFTVSVYSPAREYFVAVFDVITERKRAEEALERQRCIYQSIIDNAHTHLVYLDTDFNFVAVNSAYAKNCRYTSEELIGKNHFELYPHAENEAIFNRVKTTGRAESFHDKPFVFPDQPERGVTYWDWTLTPVKNSSGVLEGFVFSLIDTTERKKMEVTLEESKAFLDEVQIIAGIASFVFDLNDDTAQFSQNIESLIGIPVEEIPTNLTAAMDRYVNPEDRLRVAEELDSMIAKGKVWPLEFRILHPDGKVHLWVSRLQFVYDEAGQPVKCIGMVQDITDQRETENRIRILAELMETLPASITVHDFEGNFHYINRRTSELHGYTFEELQKISLQELDVPETAQHLPERMREIKEKGEAYFEASHFRKDGTTFPLQVNAKRIRWDNRDAILSIAQDITERKQAEEALRDEKERIATLLASTGDMVAAMDEDYTILFMSGELVKDFGERTGEKCYQVFCGFDAPCGMNCSVDEIIKKGKDSFEYLHEDVQDILKERIRGDAVRTLAHSNRVLETVAHPFVHQGKRCVIEVSRNITARRQAEVALRSSEIRFRQLAETVPLGIEESDLDGRIVYVNPSYSKIFGYTQQEVTQLYVWDYAVDSETLKSYIEYLSKIKPAPETWFGKYYTKNRSIIDARVDWDYRRDLQGEINGFIAVITDITEQVNLEAQFRQAQKMEAVGRLAGGVAHDFNNMLQTIIGYSELSLDRLAPDNPLHENLMEIQKAAQRSADLTRQLLAFARKQTAIPKELDLNATIAGMLNMLQRLIGEDIDLVWIPGHHLWKVKVDPSQIDQILANLTVNARDAIAGVGRITIESANTFLADDFCTEHPGIVPGEYVSLAVSDTGVGMDRETMATIFEPFFTTKDLGKGTGLGLATVYGIVKQNDGYIDVESELGHGAKFTIYLPRCQARTVEIPNVSKTKQPKGGRETLLIVEDENTILNLGKTILERLGYTVLSANDPQEAIRLVQNVPERINLLITDLIMPKMNGRDLAQTLTTMIPGLKCLYMSGYTANVMASRGILEAEMPFIQKPFKVDELADKVREVLEK